MLKVINLHSIQIMISSGSNEIYLMYSILLILFNYPIILLLE
jgi:hypothetical protein